MARRSMASTRSRPAISPAGCAARPSHSRKTSLQKGAKQVLRLQESDGLVPVEQTASDDTAPVETPATVDPAADPALAAEPPVETGRIRRGRNRLPTSPMTMPKHRSRSRPLCRRIQQPTCRQPASRAHVQSSPLRRRRRARVDGRDDWRRNAGPRRRRDRDPCGRCRGAGAGSEPHAKPGAGA